MIDPLAHLTDLEELLDCIARHPSTNRMEQPMNRLVPTKPDELPEGWARCDCGHLVELYGPSEDEHYVWAVRADGTRSNLGYCPVKHGMGEAVKRARAALSGVSLYHEKVV
jgi:hypothetical protein